MSNLSSLVDEYRDSCRDSEDPSDPVERKDAVNVQIALHELAPIRPRLAWLCQQGFAARLRTSDVAADERQDAPNVKIALQELGQHVSLEVAAEV